MNKSELIEHMAEEAGISKAAADRALYVALYHIENTLRRGGSVQIKGFGTFTVGKRAARTGRNPRTGETIEIPAKRVPTFKAGKALKEAL